MAKIKICGLRTKEDIDIVNTYKPDYAGFVIDFPKSFRSIEPQKVKELTFQLDPSICPVGVFVDEDIDVMLHLLKNKSIAMAQLHGHESDDVVMSIQAEGFSVIQAFTIHGAVDIERALRSKAEYLLLDQGKGSGKTFDWNLIPAIERPFFLAGGLGLSNMEQAIQRMHPYGLDISSGAETKCRKDRKKIQAIIEKGNQI